VRCAKEVFDTSVGDRLQSRAARREPRLAGDHSTSYKYVVRLRANLYLRLRRTGV